MPNWCENRIEVQGKPEAVEAFRLALQTKEEPFDMNKARPIPQELLDVRRGRREIDGEECRKWLVVDGKEVAVTAEMEQELLKKYGFTDWYEWALANWGTKWSATDTYLSISDSGYLLYNLDTAWGPPDEFIFYLQRAYPELDITCVFEEPGMGLYGKILAHEGR